MRRGEESVPIGGGAPRGEQQTRTLFVRNISYHTSERALLELFEKYGDVKRTFNLIDKRGMAFITYVRGTLLQCSRMPSIRLRISRDGNNLRRRRRKRKRKRRVMTLILWMSERPRVAVTTNEKRRGKNDSKSEFQIV